MDKTFRLQYAAPRHVDAIKHLLNEMHEDCGFHSKNDAKVHSEVVAAIQGGRCIMLSLDEGDGMYFPVGTVAFDLYQPWWSDDWQAMDKWLYVAKAYRSSQAFKLLVDEAVDWAHKMQVPLYIGLNSQGAERKRKLFARHMEEVLAAYQTNYVGGIFYPTPPQEG